LSTLFTYRVNEDLGGKLETAARLACNFWNHYVEPETSIVIHVDLFWSLRPYIARSYEPERRGNVTHGRIRFNLVYVRRYTELQLAGTLVHELGHTLGFGWDRWMNLFDAEKGLFTDAAIDQLPALAKMHVETDHDAATQYLHWDEEKHGSELMTGFENKSEYVLPVTIDVMTLLGHAVKSKLPSKTRLGTLLTRFQDQPFTRKDEARDMAAFDFKPSRILERIFEYLPARATQGKSAVRPKIGRPTTPKRP
jgi:hypothetical protein